MGKSLIAKSEKLLERMNSRRNKKGQVINTVSSTVFGVMFLIFIIFAVLFAIATLNPSTFFTSGSAEANATAALSSNLTEGVNQFGVQIPTVFKVLAVVMILAAIVLLILYIGRMRQIGGGNQGGL